MTADIFGRHMDFGDGTTLYGRDYSGILSPQTTPSIESQKDSVSKIASLQSPAELPAWLTKDPNSLMGEVMKLYGNIPGMTSPAALAKAYDTSINTTRGMGGQIATNASREAVARGGISGGQINSGMVKSQAMLPVYDATNKLSTDKEGAVLAAKQQQAGLMGQLATMMAQLRSNYLTKLGDLQLQSQGQTNEWTLAQQQLRLGQANKDREFNLADLARKAGSPTAATGGAVTNRGYIPNAGPIMGATVGGETVRNMSSNDWAPGAIQGWGTAAFGGGGKEMVPKPVGKQMTIQDWLKILMANGGTGGAGGSAVAANPLANFAGSDLTDQRAVA